MKLAYENRDEEYKYGFIHNRDVLIEYYGFQPVSGTEHKRNGTQIFNRRAIGFKRYMAASVAVVKAFDRLVERRAAVREYTFGIILTRRGAEVARL